MTQSMAALEVSISTPAAGASLSGRAAVAVRAVGHPGLARVDFLVDGVVRSSDTHPPYAWTWDTWSVADGTHTLGARAATTAGVWKTAQGVAVRVDNSAQGPSAYYLDSSSGDDANGGRSPSSPWRSIERANAHPFRPGDSLLFKRGGAWRGGLKINSDGVAVGAYGSGARPVLSGAVRVDPSLWKPHRGAVYSARVGSIPPPSQLFVDGVLHEAARYPHAGFRKVTADSPDNKSFIDSTLSLSAGQLAGADILARSNNWSIDLLKVSGFSNYTITTSSPLLRGTMKKGWGYVLRGKPWMLDAPGEWCYDKDSGNIYLWARGGDSPAAHEVEISRVASVVESVGRSNVAIKDLKIVRADAHGVHVQDGRGNKVAGVETSGGYLGVYVKSADSEVLDNSVSASLWGGVYVVGNNAVVKGNRIERVCDEGLPFMRPGLGGGAEGGIGLFIRGDNASVSGNAIARTGYNGMTLWGKNAGVQGNSVEDYLLKLDDGGGIYAWSPLSMGSRIAGNTVRNSTVTGNVEGTPSSGLLVSGIYLDSGDSVKTDISVEGNLVERAAFGILVHNAFGNSLRGNRVLDAGTGLRIAYDAAFPEARDTSLDQLVFGNVFEASSRAWGAWGTPYCVHGRSFRAPVERFGTRNDNLYCRPSDAGAVFEQDNVGSHSYLSLAAWRSASGEDMESTEKIGPCSASDAAPPIRPTVRLSTASIDGSVHLEWAAFNADSCRASGEWSGPRPAGGREALSGGGTYALSCSNDQGTVSRSVVVADTAPPSMSDPAVSAVFSASAAVRWSTDVPATGRVEYGTSPACGNSSPLAAALSTGHAVSLTGLAPSTTYYWRALSADAVGNLASAAGPAFRTLSPEAVRRVLGPFPVWAGHPVGFSIAESSGRQFLAFYDEHRRMSVAQRTLDSDEWTITALPRTVGWDSHNSLEMAIDDGGFIHLSGDMHADPLVYFRSARPLDARSLERVPGMTGANEARCTYPKFMRGPKNEFLFTYRDGSSGDGNQIYNVYDLKTRTWKRLLDKPLTDGQGARNAYFVGPVLGPDGFYHLSYVWREDPDAATNHDLSYARSKDLVHWETGSGKALSLPITLASGEIVDPVPVHGGLLNGHHRIGFDRQNRAVITYHKFDADGNTQIYNARLEGGRWKIHQTTRWDYRWDFSGGGSLVSEISAGAVAPEPDGGLGLSYSHAKYGSGVWRLDEEDFHVAGMIERPSSRPAGFEGVESDFPKMKVRWLSDEGASGVSSVTYWARWETLDSNRDRPRDPPWPEPSLLRVLRFDARDVPSVALSPWPGGVLHGTVTVRAAVSASTPVARVDFLVDDKLMAGDSRTPFAWAWDTFGAANGTHTLKARVHSVSGLHGSTSAVVRVGNSAPSVSLTAYPDAVALGRESALAWASTGAASCVASGGWSGPRAGAGRQFVAPAAGSTYTLTCWNPAGASTASALVSVIRMEDRPVRMPESFPAAMTSGAGGGLRGEEFRRKLEELAPYAVLHAVGDEGKTSQARDRYPDKVLTQQMAYGGVSEAHFEAVWPGHWLYKAGTRLSKAVSVSDSVLFVQDPSRINGSIPKSTDTLPLCLILYALDERGLPDWDHAEHLVLVQRLPGGGLKVQRGRFASKPLAAASGRGVVAEHMPFSANQWQLNLSLHCPRGGPQNLTAAEWYAQEAAKRVISARSDGVEFDSGRWAWGRPEKNPMDVDNDLAPDYGYLRGVNSFGLGGQVLFRELRSQLGPGKIIQADSNDALYGARGWKYLSGVRLESFPASNDSERFSEAFEHLRLFAGNAEGAVRFSYPFTKAAGTYFSGDARGDGKFRSGLAAACLAGMPHPFNAIDEETIDPEDPGGAETVVNRGPFAWDEYYGGDLKDWSWLGKPLGEPRRDSSALSSVNLLAEANWSWARDSGFEAVSSGGSGAYSSEVRRTPEGISPGENLWFGVRLEPSGRIPALVPGREYTLDFEARGGDSWEVDGQSFDRVPRSVMVRGPFASRSGRPVSVPADSVWRRHLVSVVASSEAVRGPVFGVSEQAGLTQLRNPRLREGGAERWSREFEHGLVLLNGTLQPWTVTVATNTYRRLKGSQDPEVNDGGRVGGRVVVPARDAAFLFKVPMPPELSLFASPGEVFPGGDALLVWASTAADACSASGAWTGARAASGSEAVALVLGSTYTLSCTGPGGGVSRSVFVSVSTGLGPPAGTAWVKAAPNPCVVEAGKTECSAAVSWDAGSVPEGRQAQVMAGGALFACGGKGARAAPWIRPGRDYSFELRLATSCTASAGVLRLDSTTARGVPASAVPKPALGMNKFDLARQYLGTASGGDGSEAYRKLTQAMARKAIADARGMGARFLRVSASGYSPSDLELWRSSPSAYWGLMDRMMDDLAAEGVGCVPVFLWNAFQFPTLAGEGLDRMLTDPESASARLALGFAGGFIARYKRHPALYFYELTNELNLLADLDMVKRCQSPSEACHGFRAGNFTTDQMIAFTSRFAASLRGLDPDHLYSSGFSIPRPAAEHLRRKPEWVPPYGVDWTADSPSELAKNVADIHEGLDLVSAHLYNGGKGNERFGHAGHAEAGLLRELRDAAEGAGKRLYLGEFGDISPYLKDDPRGLFTQNALSKVVELGVPYASPWVLEMYYPTPYETYSAPPNYHNWEPGYTDLLIEKFKAANLGLGNGAPSGQAPPRVVLTWPLEGSVIVSTSQPLHAVASAGSRPAARVRFQVDGATLCVSTSPPFQCRLDARLLPRGAHVLEAAAFDEAGSSAAYRTPVSGGLLELSVALSTPLSGSVLRATVSVEARVSPSTAASRVDFLVDGVLQAGDAHGPFRWAWDTRKSPDGRHTLTARAYAGLSSLSASAVVEVDNSGADAPELSLRAEPGRIVRGRSSLLLWSSTGASSCLASGAWSGSKALSGSLAVSPAASSTYTLTCAGPGGSLARSAFLQVASDTAPPSVSILFPADRSVWSSTGPLMVSARVFDDAGVAWARLLAGGVPVSTRTQAPFDFAWEPPACGPGAHSLRVEAFDAAGNSGFDEVSVSLGLAGCAWVSVPSSGTEVRLGGAGLSLPAGALPEGATLRVMMEGLDDPSAVSRRLDKAKARGLSPAGEGIIADAGGVPLSAPVQLTMSIASPGTVPAGLSSSYGVYAWDEAAGDWSPLGTRTDPVSMTASAQSPVLSVFRVFSVPAMTNGAVGDIFVFPNPAKRTDPTVHVDCAGAESVEIKIYDFLGAKVNEATLTGAPNTTADRGHGPKPAYEYTWSPAGAASGVYFYSVRVRLQGQGEVRKSGKFALIR